MDKVFDNGYKVLGTIGNVKKYIQNNCDSIEEVKELLEDLSQYQNDIFVVVDYDNSMGYYIDYFFKDSEVQL
jgi:hemerythrin